MNDLSAPSRITYGAVLVQPAAVRRIRGLSDKALAWLFITPTMVLLLAINIFPLVWTIYLSFTNYRANRANAPVKWLGIDWYQTILTDPDIWAAMQVTAHFVFWTVVIETVLGFGLAFLIDKKFRGHGVWTTIILLPMMLSPAVVGNFWTFLYQPQIGLFNYVVAFFTGRARIVVPDAGRRDAQSLGDRHRRRLDVDALCDADLPCRPAIDPGLHL